MKEIEIKCLGRKVMLKRTQSFNSCAICGKEFESKFKVVNNVYCWECKNLYNSQLRMLCSILVKEIERLKGIN